MTGTLEQISGLLHEAGETLGPRLRDLDHNEAMALAVRPDFAMRSYGLTGVRILDLLILSVTAAARRLALTGLFAARAGKAILVRSEQDRPLASRLRVAEVLQELGRTKEASEAGEVAAAGYEQALRDRPDEIDLKIGLADALPWTTSGRMYESKIEIFRRIVTLREEVFKARPIDGRSKQKLALAHSRLYTQLDGVRPVEAFSALERSAVLRLELAEEFPDDADAIEGVFTSLFKIAQATVSTQSLALFRRALEFGRESLRLRPNDPRTAHDFSLATQNAVARYRDLGRKDEAIVELGRSVRALDGMARANPDTPVIQERYLVISRDLADRLAEQDKPGDAVRTLLESRMAIDRLSRNTADELVGAANWSLAIAKRLGEIQPDLTPEQKAQRDELLDRVVTDYRAAVAGGWKDVARLKEATPIKDHPGYAALLAEAESAATKTVKPIASSRPAVMPVTNRSTPTVSRPKLDVKLDRATIQAALGAARARTGLVDEALATMDKARASFDELARERPGDSEVARVRVDALLGFYTAMSALALDRQKRGKDEASAAARRMADDVFAEVSRGRPNDPEVDAARRKAVLDVADFRREASHWGETYAALRKEDSNARQLARGASAGSPTARSAVASLSRIGYGYGKLALWDEASGALRTAYELDSVGLRKVEGAGDTGYAAWYRVAVLLLQGGETEAYERLRERLLRENAVGNLGSPLDQIRTATLRPDPLSDWKQVLDLASKFPAYHPWGPTVKGFALLRAGKHQEAIDEFKHDPDWINGWPARTIAHHRLGQSGLAREWLARADQHVREDLDEALAGAGFTQTGWVSWWDDWLLRMIWTREAHELIEGKAWPDASWMRQQRARALARIEEAK